MYINVVSIGTNSNIHSIWELSQNTNTNITLKKNCYFFESSDSKVLQKIKIGGPDKMFPSDFHYAGNYNILNAGYITPEIHVQTFEFPFGKVYVNPKNLNPFIAGFEDNESSDRLIVVLLGKEFQYIRSATNHSVGEIISTFTTPDSIGCIIKVSEEDFDKVVDEKLSQTETAKVEDINVLTFDVFDGKHFKHFRVNLRGYKDMNEVDVVESTIKNVNLIKRLKQLNDRYGGNIHGRRFVRFTTKLITSAFIVPYNLVDAVEEQVLDKHGMSDAVPADTEFMLFGVNVDEDGKIKNDKELKKVREGLKANKFKAFTLIGCKLTKSTFEKNNPLYIFSLDETEKLNDPKDIKTVKSVKSN